MWNCSICENHNQTKMMLEDGTTGKWWNEVFTRCQIAKVCLLMVV